MVSAGVAIACCALSVFLFVKPEQMGGEKAGDESREGLLAGDEHDEEYKKGMGIVTSSERKKREEELVAKMADLDKRLLEIQAQSPKK